MLDIIIRTLLRFIFAFGILVLIISILVDFTLIGIITATTCILTIIMVNIGYFISDSCPECNYNLKNLDKSNTNYCPVCGCELKLIKYKK